MNDILRKYGVKAGTEILGEGVEAKVYPINDDKVLRIFKSSYQPSKVMLTNLYDFYNSFNRSQVSFAVPEILTIDENYTIDRRLSGQNLNIIYESLSIEQKHHMLDSYIEAAGHIRNLHPNYQYFGEILSDRPIRHDSWVSFLEHKLRSALSHGTLEFTDDVPEVPRIVDVMLDKLTLFADVTEATLVHGDYYFPNILVENGTVSAVLDFNELTLAGDYKMDLASAVIYLDQFEAEDSSLSRQAYTDKLAEKYGDSIREIIEFYELYYAIIFASYTKQTDSSAYQWAVTTLKRYCEKRNI